MRHTRLACAAALMVAAPATAPAQMPEPGCPGPLQGHWFTSDYQCGRVFRAQYPKHSDDDPIEEWAADYRVQGRNVTVEYDGRYRRYRPGEPAPEWKRGRPSRRVMVISEDGCSAVTDQAWPRIVRRSPGTRCPLVHGTYSWAPGAPDDVPLAAVVYEGSISPDGNVTLTSDPNSRLFTTGTPAVMRGWWGAAGRVRFVGEELHAPTGSPAARRITMRVRLSEAEDLPTTSEGLMVTMLQHADAERMAGRRWSARLLYAEAASTVSRKASRRGSLTPIHVRIKAGDLVRMRLDDPAWDALADEVREEVAMLPDLLGDGAQAADPAARAQRLRKDGNELTWHLPDDQARAETARLEAAAAAILETGKTER